MDPPSRPRHAVIVVTDLLARTRLSEAAAAAGYAVTTLRSVPPASALADAGVPDVVVIDLDMPGAVAGAAALVAAFPAIRVRGFAFHAEEALIAEARAAGVEVLPHGTTARPARLFSEE
jgi:CheY-like chemotaxis protein